MFKFKYIINKLSLLLAILFSSIFSIKASNESEKPFQLKHNFAVISKQGNKTKKKNRPPSFDHLPLLVDSEQFPEEKILQQQVIPSIVLKDREKQEELRLQAQKLIFHGHLEKIKKKNSQKSPSIFLLYDQSDQESQKWANSLAEDLALSGVPSENILFDQSPVSLISDTYDFQFIDNIFEAERVIVIGSASLKRKYKTRKGIVNHQIDLLRTRMIKVGATGIIPIWFKGSHEESFPESLQALSSHSLVADYSESFFDLLIDIYQLNPVKNNINKIRQDFKRRKHISQDMLARYETQLLQEKLQEN